MTAPLSRDAEALTESVHVIARLGACSFNEALDLFERHLATIEPLKSIDGRAALVEVRASLVARGPTVACDVDGHGCNESEHGAV